jgi:hypothetical protein
LRNLDMVKIIKPVKLKNEIDKIVKNYLNKWFFFYKNIIVCKMHVIIKIG